MDKTSIIQKTEEYVKEKLKGDHTGHDWQHIKRVRDNALHIAKRENADLLVVELVALLHDIADWKFHGGDDSAGPKLAGEWLELLNAESDVINHVCGIIKEVSFKGAGVKSNIKTKEGMAVQDADRLDAMGAVGIARVFMYGGYKGIEMHDPEIKPKMHESFDDYKSSKSTCINHFYEKLLLLKDLMNTETGREMAEERHRFMEEYLKRFLEDVGGKNKKVH